MDVMILLECQDPRAAVTPLVIIEAREQRDDLTMIHGMQKVAPSNSLAKNSRNHTKR